jgi:hypothetical protein
MPDHIDFDGIKQAALPEDWNQMSLGALWDHLNRTHRTPQTTIEAVVHCVGERGVAALKEPANIERLLRCDDGAKTKINERIARQIAAKKIAA